MISCSMCGTVADAAVDGDPPLLWTLSIVRRGAGAAAQQWVCTRCTRDNARSIEAKLDEDYW